jgi:Ca2+-transporting ATPase
VAITGLLLFIPPLTAFFEFAQLSIRDLLLAIGIGFISVIWYELVKIKARLSSRKATAAS